jgi:hypothetical protein
MTTPKMTKAMPANCLIKKKGPSSANSLRKLFREVTAAVPFALAGAPSFCDNVDLFVTGMLTAVKACAIEGANEAELAKAYSALRHLIHDNE